MELPNFLRTPEDRAGIGNFVLQNHLILERILVNLPVRDILNLKAVSRELYRATQFYYPRVAETLGLSELPNIGPHELFRFLKYYLERDCTAPQRHLFPVPSKRPKEAVSTAGHIPKNPYTRSWARLVNLDLSGTNISTSVIKLFILISAPGLPDISDKTARQVGPIYYDRGLRLRKLSFKNCPNVDVRPLLEYLNLVIDVATAPFRARLRQHQINLQTPNQQAPAGAVQGGGLAQLQQQALFAIHGGQNTNQNHHFANLGHHHNHHHHHGNPAPQHLRPETTEEQHLSVYHLTSDFLSSIPRPLPKSYEELAIFNLSCLTLRTLELADIGNLPIAAHTPQYDTASKPYPDMATISQLHMLTGILGLTSDIILCQGFTCSRYMTEDLENHSSLRALDLPLPHLPHTRTIITPEGQPFFIPLSHTDKDDLTAASTTDWPTAASYSAAGPATALTTGLFEQPSYEAPRAAIGPPSTTGPAPPDYVGSLFGGPPTVPRARPTEEESLRELRGGRYTPVPVQVRKKWSPSLAMNDAPRGVCEGCGRELWLCSDCNRKLSLWCRVCGCDRGL